MNIMNTRALNQSPLNTSGDLSGGICRNFIWGCCFMGAQCIYRHDLEFEAMKSVLKFCYDHQNRSGCTRPGCTYLHTSREEQNLFLTTGQIPRVLINRYTDISNAVARAPPVSGNVISVQQQPHNMMYDYITHPPPPLPPQPVPAPTGAGVQHSPMVHSSQGPMMGPISRPIQGPIPCPMQGPIPSAMQGPIPSVMPPTSSVSYMKMAAPVYSSPLSPYQSSLYNTAVPQTTLPPMFDPSRPPPPIPQATPSRLLKRVANNCEAGPSKLRKMEPTNDSCECCVQRLIRANELSQHICRLKLQADQERSKRNYKMDNYEKKNNILKSLTNPDIYLRALEYIENGSPSPISPRSELNNPNLASPVTASLNATNDLVQQLIERFRAISTREVSESISSAGLMPIHARARSNNSSADILTTILDLLRNDREAGNGFSRFLGDGASPLQRPLFEAGAKAGLLTSTSALPCQEAGAPASQLMNASLRPYAHGGAAASSATLPYTNTAPAALPYGETGPPPPRSLPPPPAPCEPPALPPHLPAAPNNMPNPPYPGAALNQPPRPPMPPPNNPYFMGGRYPNQHYYPPYQ